jgi:thiamine pyrophosphokinase
VHVLDCTQLFPRGWNGNSDARRNLSLFEKGTVVMLNSPDALPSYFEQLWTRDKFRVCADGAANRLFSIQQRRADVLAPHVIVGDFDSARPEVLRHFEAQGVVVVRRPSQDSTDLQKVMAYHGVDDARRHRGGATAVLGGMGGFLSHQLANLSELLPQSLSRFHSALYFMSEHEICFVLRAGRNILSFEEIDHEHPMVCSLIPLFGPVRSVTSQGLCWNLSEQRMAFGDFISTSNVVSESVVTVQCSEPLLWILDARRTEKKD